MESKTRSYNKFLRQWQRLRPRAQFSIPEILQWVDAYHQRHGHWPSAKSGKVRGSLAEFWRLVDNALRHGRRGLEGGSSLAKFLWEKRGVRNVYSKPRLTEEQILKWADAYREQTGKWPGNNSKKAPNAEGEKWVNIDAALIKGLRDLKGGSSLAKLLEEKRGVRNQATLAGLEVPKILGWADAYHRRTGKWPTAESGAIDEAPGETWRIVDGALQKGRRGFTKGSSLARVLTQHRGKRNQFAPPRLTVDQILSWADAHHQRTGEWPGFRYLGPIPEAPGEIWQNLNRDLRLGLRGLPKTTLKLLLAQHRGVPHIHAQQPLTVEQILGWADLHREKTGKWPKCNSGGVLSAPAETWKRIDAALALGRRGLPRGETLAQLLAKHRRIPVIERRQTPLTETQILSWADSHRRRTGSWPTLASGPVQDAPGERWHGLNRALIHGLRGLPKGRTLRNLLAELRGVRNRKYPPLLDFVKLLTWADDFHHRHKRWPTHKDGAIKGAHGEKWSMVNAALMQRRRGLRGGTSLAKFLSQHRGAPYKRVRRTLNVTEILLWVDLHRKRTGDWPKLSQYGDPVPEAPDVNWRIIDRALSDGSRGLPGGSTLQLLLAKHRNVRHAQKPVRLNVEQILRWADEHFQKTGSWPKGRSRAEVLSAPGETWSGINVALIAGLRGLPGGESLPQLLNRQRGVRNHLALPPLSLEQILAWADIHHQRIGRWPTSRSGTIPEAPSENWSAIDVALFAGRRGFPGSQTLPQVLAQHRGKRNMGAAPQLKVESIRKWGKAHHKRTGKWPRRDDGPITEAPGETWNAVQLALLRGTRGLKGGSSLPRLFQNTR